MRSGDDLLALRVCHPRLDMELCDTDSTNTLVPTAQTTVLHRQIVLTYLLWRRYSKIGKVEDV